MAFGVAASVFLVLAYVRYLFALRHEVPNPVSISLWMAWMIINFTTYRMLTSRAAMIMPTVQLLCMTLMDIAVVMSVRRLGWQRVRATCRIHWTDFCVTAIVCVGYGIKVLAHNPMLANWALQLALIGSFIPFTKQAFFSHERMNPMPWFLGAGAYFFLILSAIPDGPGALVFPAIGLLCHAAVWIGTLQPRRPSEYHTTL